MSNGCDQAKAEWKNILEKLAELEHQIPILASGIPDHEGLDHTMMGILPILRSTIFVYAKLQSSGFIGRWENYVQYIGGRVLLNTHTTNPFRPTLLVSR